MLCQIKVTDVKHLDSKTPVEISHPNRGRTKASTVACCFPFHMNWMSLSLYTTPSPLTRYRVLTEGGRVHSRRGRGHGLGGRTLRRARVDLHEF